MPQIDLDGMKVAGDDRKAPPSFTIDGSSIDITGREDIDEDTARLSSEPEFKQDKATYREPLAGLLAPQTVGGLPHGPLRKLDPKRLNSKWQLMEQLSRTIPLNQYEQPEYIYRADLLDHREFQSTLLNRSHVSGSSPVPTTATSSSPLSADLQSIDDLAASLTCATVHLSYYEGFPVADKKPFWNQLLCEPEGAYDAFKAYLTSGPTRSTTDLIAYPIEDVEEWFHIYYWSWRVRAFELYRIVNAEKLKLTRMLDTEDSHYTKAAALFTRVSQSLDSFTGEELKEVGFDKLIAAMEKLVKIQRISTGLNVNGGTIDENASKSAPTTQIIMQQITANTPSTEKKVEEEYNLLEEDPDQLELAQKLLINVQQGQDLK